MFAIQGLNLMKSSKAGWATSAFETGQRFPGKTLMPMSPPHTLLIISMTLIQIFQTSSFFVVQYPGIMQDYEARCCMRQLDLSGTLRLRITGITSRRGRISPYIVTHMCSQAMTDDEVSKRELKIGSLVENARQAIFTAINSDDSDKRTKVKVISSVRLLKNSPSLIKVFFDFLGFEDKS